MIQTRRTGIVPSAPHHRPLLQPSHQQLLLDQQQQRQQSKLQRQPHSHLQQQLKNQVHQVQPLLLLHPHHHHHHQHNNASRRTETGVDNWTHSRITMGARELLMTAEVSRASACKPTSGVLASVSPGARCVVS